MLYEVITNLIPFPCMHCDNAPCVTVCPARATYHREDGIEKLFGAEVREIFGTTETGSVGWRNTAREESFIV